MVLCALRGPMEKLTQLVASPTLIRGFDPDNGLSINTPKRSRKLLIMQWDKRDIGAVNLFGYSILSPAIAFPALGPQALHVPSRQVVA